MYVHEASSEVVELIIKYYYSAKLHLRWNSELSIITLRALHLGLETCFGKS